GPEVFPTVHRLDQVEVIGIYHGTFDAVQISFDRGVQMVQLRRREDMRRSALVRDAEDQRSARRRFRARSKHGDESGTTRGLGNDVGDLRVAPDGPEQRAGGPFLLHHVEGPPERFQLIRFLDEVDRPSLHRLDRGVDRPLARDHDHGGLGPHNPETMQDLQSGGFGHPKVEEGHVERLPLDRAKRFTPVRGGDDGVSVLTQERGELFPEGLVVIGDENLHAASLRGRRTVTVAFSPTSTSRVTPFVRFRGICETADRTTDRRSVSMGWICRLFERLTNPWTILAARRRSVSIFSSFPSATGSVTRLLAADVRREIVVRGVFNSWAMKPASWPIVASRSASNRRSWARLRSMAMATCSATKLSTRLSSSSKRTPSA